MPAGTGPAGKAAGDIKKKHRVIKIAADGADRPKPLEGVNTDELVFALDIGTRSVVGVVGIQDGDRFRIICTEVLEHRNRAMMDGQIHDIDQVAAIAGEVKDRIEGRLGITLKRVAIAAAGRVLKTSQVRVDKELEAGAEIDQEMVSSLEIDGIQRAQAILDADMPDEDRTQYYCVGYSVVNYYLNGYVISNLKGHRGKTVGADILATFLPHVVVDSLYTVMSRIGLEVSSLTLEPIAAINVTIPADLRLLNLALVDIGAGTSDIAVTKDGSIIAYAMAPIAGDEITEKISQYYLVDFNTGEKIKIALSSSRESIAFTDILKIKRSVRVSEVAEIVRPAVETLADNIAGRILEYNHKSPNAVFLIGGGSQIPGLAGMIAHRLDLPAERVVVRGREVIKGIKFNDKKLSGPESITPYGIAVTAQLQRGRDFMSVTVNGKKVRLFNSRKLSVADALVLVGFNPGRLIGRSGKSRSFTVNGEKRVVRGGHGKAAEIYVNGAAANLETVIRYGDSIRVVEAEDGRDAEVRVSDIAGRLEKGRVTLNGSFIDISANVFINGENAREDTVVNEGEAVEIYRIRTLEDLLKAGGIDTGDFEISVNGKQAESGYLLQDGDAVEYRKIDKEKEEKTVVSVPQFTEEPAAAETAGELAGEMFDASWVRLVVNGSEIILKENKTQYIFVDIFNYIDFDLTRPKGSIVLRLNGHQAAFTDVIRTGDEIEIYWQK
jgi:cell division protein FtsA